MVRLAEELSRGFLRKLNDLALIAERSYPGRRAPKEYWRRKLSHYFVHVNYTVMVERIRRNDYPAGFMQEKLQQIEEFKMHPERLGVVLIVGTHAESAYDISSCSTVINETAVKQGVVNDRTRSNQSD